MKLMLNQTEAKFMITLDCDLSQIEKGEAQVRVSDDTLHAIRISLINFLSESGEWDDTLSEWFPRYHRIDNEPDSNTGWVMDD